ncbi:hypothetical protein cypCar_00008044 [Cyprinus carpio]|nr:hypothetical protein cypCar_00008044 [Cyprinus carpio]
MSVLTGNSPTENKGTYITVYIGKERRGGRWKGRVIGTQNNDVTVGITPDASCIIGRFNTFVTVMTDVGKQRTPRNPDTDFYVLFNPWDPADVVYMPRDNERQEYVMNDVGIIYNGEFNNIAPRSWNYGQFEEGILDACLLVLDAGKVPLLYRGNAIELVRQGSALMNSQDDDGVLVGNWSGDYSIGTSPTAWTGSPEILLKYAKDGGLPVCFAQCWVYAGVLNTCLYRCGPTSVIAIKEGELSYPFDARFVFAEVNSDVVYYQSDKYGNSNIISVDTTNVGKLIVTKRVNSNDYEDITSTYKYPEGSDQDKQAMQMAERRGVPARDYTKPAETGVAIELQADTIRIGENFKLTLNIKNQTSQKCTLNATITGCVVYYTGVTSSIFKLDSKTASVDPWKTTKVMIDVAASEYMPYRVEQSNLLFVVYGRIQETGTALTTTRVVAPRPPDLTIKVTGAPRVGKDFMVTVSFRNPFNFILNNVQLRLESPAYLLQAVRAAGKCETVFKGFSDCLLKLGENMANYPQELDEKENLQTICT